MSPWYRRGLFVGGLTALLFGQPMLAVAAEPAAAGPAADSAAGKAKAGADKKAVAPSTGKQATATKPVASKETGVVARVDDMVVTADDFEAAMRRAARQKFYHGKIIPERLLELRRAVIDELVVERLVIREAEARGITPDMAEVDGKLSVMEERYKDSAEWLAQRDEVLPLMKERMIVNSRKSRLEKQIRELPPPGNAELVAFYEANKDLFTEPVRDRVAVILLKVDPSSSKVTWEEAAAEAGRIRSKIMAGGEFAELAKLHSGDPSAANGGDMGYMHVGRLGAAAHQAVQSLAVGEVTDPVELLEGYGLFRLIDRKPSRLRSFDDVRQRARELYGRNKAEEVWTAFIAKLKASATIWISPEITAATQNP